MKLQLTSAYQELIFSNLKSFMSLEKVTSFFYKIDIDFKVNYFFPMVPLLIRSIHVLLLEKFPHREMNRYD